LIEISYVRSLHVTVPFPLPGHEESFLYYAASLHNKNISSLLIIHEHVFAFKRDWDRFFMPGGGRYSIEIFLPMDVTK
jgi:hypothetical protein